MNSSTQRNESTDPFDLRRFVSAQEHIYQNVVRELASGRKQSHWMWFIFPQLIGLGRSPMAQQYAIRNLDEACRYLEHPLLGARLLECTRLVTAVQGHTAHEIFGSPDDLKFHSSMTLFEYAAPAHNEFTAAIEKYYAGTKDALTLQLLRDSSMRGYDCL